MAEIGYATLAVIPSFKGFGTALQRGTAREMTAAGVAGGGRFGDSAGLSAGRSSSSRFTSTLKNAGLFGGLAGAFGAASFIKDSVELEATFSKTMAQIGVATEAPAEQIERLDALAMKLGKDTVFSASEASGAMLELAKNGITPATIEAGALQSALTLAAAGGVDMTEAATTMGNALNAFNIKGKESKSVAAALAGAANASSASISSIAEGLQQVSAVSADSGFTLQETTGALAAFANAGISGSDAGTSLKTAFSRLIPQTAKAKGVMQQYGLLTYDAAAAAKDLAKMGLKPLGEGYEGTYKAIEKYLAGQGVAEEGTVAMKEAVEKYLSVSGIMRNDFLKSNGEFKDLASIAGELSTAFKDLSDSERAQALNTLFGSDARRAATVLMNEGAEGIRKYTAATSDQAQAEKLAKANMEGTAGAIERLKGSWENAKLEFGKALAPLAEKALDFLADSIDDVAPKLEDLASWLTDHTDEFATFADGVGDVAGKVGDLVGFLNDLPKEVKLGGLAGIVGGGALLKMRGGGGGLTGAAGSALGLTRPINVFVTNPGFGAAGGTTAVAGGVPDSKTTRTAKPGRLKGKGGALALIASIVGPQLVKEFKELLEFPTSEGQPFEREGAVVSSIVSAFEDVLDGKEFKGSFTAFADIAAGAEKSAKQIVGAYDTLPKTLQTRFDLLGVPETEKELRHLLRVYDIAAKDRRTTLELMGYNVMLDRIARINKELDWAARPREARISITKAYAAAGYQTRGGLQEGGGGPVERNRSRTGGGL